MKLLKNATILNDDFQLQKADILIDGETICKIGTGLSSPGAEILDFSGKTIIPGLIDSHTHGCAGVDTCNGSIEDLKTMSRFYASIGVTSFVPTSMTLGTDTLEKTFRAVADFIKEGDAPGAYAHGIHMEGPYCSAKKVGAQNPAFLQTPDVDKFRNLNKCGDNLVKIVVLAPELEGSMEFIREISKDITVSIAHSAADYETAMEAIANGVTHITHLYNAMTPYTHREPGIIGAAYDSDVACELICDGIHVHPAVIRSTFRQIGEDRVVFISDSMEAAGLDEGEYELGGQKVFVKEGAARLANGALAGSATTLMNCVRKAVEFGVPFESAVKAATINPAKEIKADDVTGSIKAGKFADLVVLNPDLSLDTVFVKGKRFEK